MSDIIDFERFGNRGTSHPFTVKVGGHRCYFAAHELSTDNPLGQEVLARYQREVEADDSRLVRIER